MLAGAVLAIARVALAIGVVATLVAIGRARPQPWVLAAAAAGLALRAWAPASPHEVNPRWTAAFTDRVDLSYGASHPEALRALAALFGPDADLPMHAGLAFAALAGVAIPVAARAWGASARVAVLWAWMIAVDPLLVRAGHTDGPYGLEALLVAGAVLLSTRDASRWHLAGAAAAWVAATQCRPEGLVWLPVALAAWGLAERPRGAGLALGVAAALCLPWVAWLGTHGGDLLPSGGYDHPLRTHGWRHLVFLDPAWTALPATALLAAGLVSPALPGRARAGLLGAALALAAVMPVDTWSTAGGRSPINVRHQLRAIPLIDGLRAAGIDALARSAPGPVRAVAVVAMFPAVRTAWTPTTLDAEWAFLRDAVPRLPAGCTVITPRPHSDGALKAPHWLGAVHGQTWHLVDDGGPIPDHAGCLVWHRPAACWLHDNPTGRGLDDVMRPTCAAWEARLDLVPLAEASLVAIPPLYLRFRRDPVPVGLYRVGRTADDPGPPPPR